MKTLDLEKVWRVMNTLCYEETVLAEEQDKYVSLLGNGSSYTTMSFEGFLEYYSFKIDSDTIAVYNDDLVPYEDYSNNDFSYFPSVLLSFSADKLQKWIKTEIKLQLEAQEREKIAEKERIKQQIAQLNKQLDRL